MADVTIDQLPLTSAVAAEDFLVVQKPGQTARVVATAFVGPQGAPGTPGQDGAQGPAGADGAQGERGPAGADGADGTNGENGADGTNATITPFTDPSLFDAYVPAANELAVLYDA